MRFQAGLSIALLSTAGFAPVAECTVDTALKVIQTAGELAGAGANIKKIWDTKTQARRTDGVDVAFAVELEDADQDEGSLVPRAKSCGITVPAGVPSNVIENCCNSLAGKTLYFSGWKKSKSKSMEQTASEVSHADALCLTEIRVEGIPYPCISAAPWFDNTDVVPYACGDTCLEWAGVSYADFDAVTRAFGF